MGAVLMSERTHDDDNGGGIIELPESDDDPTIAAIAEVLREPGARLAGDAEFFLRIVRPLYATYGHAAVDAALRQVHDDIRRRAASEIRQLRNHAARLKRSSEGL
jgi:hypothetical protein